MLYNCSAWVGVGTLAAYSDTGTGVNLMGQRLWQYVAATSQVNLARIEPGNVERVVQSQRQTVIVKI
jgi:hypothetical protein